jgi:ketosteroid isomerase-like protein
MPRDRVHRLTKWSCLLANLAALLALGLTHAAAWPAKPQASKPAIPRSERHETKHEIDQMEETWRNAALHHDSAAMADLLSDDYIGISASGTLQSKDETLAGLRAGLLQFTQLDLSDRKVRFYGQTALVTSRAEVTGSGSSGPISGSYRYTRVYVRDSQGKWKIVSFEASPIRDIDARK